MCLERTFDIPPLSRATTELLSPSSIDCTQPYSRTKPNETHLDLSTVATSLLYVAVVVLAYFPTQVALNAGIELRRASPPDLLASLSPLRLAFSMTLMYLSSLPSPALQSFFSDCAFVSVLLTTVIFLCGLIPCYLAFEFWKNPIFRTTPALLSSPCCCMYVRWCIQPFFLTPNFKP